MIHAEDAVVRAFAAVGWGWGGYWDSLKDYQHFSATGR
jgi:poly-gamma-glutamate synthesis protein (capsule biosynthesis protein)